MSAWPTCHKLAFRTVESAERTVQIISGIRGSFRKPKRIYLCPRCDQYHLSGKEEAEVPHASTVAQVSQSTPSGLNPAPARADESGSTPQPARGAREAGLSSPKPPKMEGPIRQANKIAKEAVQRADRAEARATWMLEKMRLAATSITDGEPLLAYALLRACVSLPRKFATGRDVPAAERWIDQQVSDRLRWHLAGRPMKERGP